MGCYFTKPTAALWAATPSPKAIARKILSSASPKTERPPSPTSILSYSPIERRKPSFRAKPLGASRDVSYKCRKSETIAMERSAYVTKFFAQGCEDCVFVICCAVKEVNVLDCKRCVFVFGPTTDSTTARDCLGCDIATCATVGAFTLEDCVNVRAFVKTYGNGSRARAERCSTTAFGTCDLEYDELEEQMASCGFVDANGDLLASTMTVSSETSTLESTAREVVGHALERVDG